MNHKFWNKTTNTDTTQQVSNVSVNILSKSASVLHSMPAVQTKTIQRFFEGPNSQIFDKTFEMPGN